MADVPETATLPDHLERGAARPVSHWVRAHKAIVVAVVIVAYAAFALATLLDYPPVYADEPWELSPAVSLLRTGHVALPIFGEHYTGYFYYAVYLAAFLKIVGVSVAAGRIVSVIHGVGILILTFAISRRLGAGRFAAVAPLTLVFLYPFNEVSRYIRPDVMVTFYALLGVLLYLVARSRRSLLFSVFSGLAVGWAFGLFMLGVWGAAIVGALALFDLRRAPRLAGGVALGAAAALTPLLIHIAMSYGEYRRFMTKFGNSSFFSARHQQQGFFHTLTDIAGREPQRYDNYFVWSNSHLYLLAISALVAAGIAVSVKRNRFTALAAIGLLAIPLVCLALFADNKTPAYFLSAAPGVAVLAAIAGHRLRWPVPVAVAVLAFVYINTLKPQTQFVTPYSTIARWYQTNVSFPPGSIVIGQPDYYAHFMNNSDVRFFTLHYFTSFKTFQLLDDEQNERKLNALARDHAVYLVYSEPAFTATMVQFDFNGRAARPFKRFLRDHFVVEKRHTFVGTPYGTFTDRIARYVRQNSG